MKKNKLYLIGTFALVLVLGIVGAVECGASCWRCLWCLPLLGVAGVCFMF